MPVSKGKPLVTLQGRLREVGSEEGLELEDLHNLMISLATVQSSVLEVVSFADEHGITCYGEQHCNSSIIEIMYHFVDLLLHLLGILL